MFVQRKVTLNRELQETSDDQHPDISAVGSAGRDLALEGPACARVTVTLRKAWRFGCSGAGAPSAHTAVGLA